MSSPSAGIDRAHYHGWQGRLRSPWLGALAVARVALWQIARRKLCWLVIALGLTHFLAFFTLPLAVAFLTARMDAAVRKSGDPGVTGAQDSGGSASRPRRAEGFSAWILSLADLTPPPRAGEIGRDNGYVDFMDRQCQVVLILLAFSGSLVAGGDFQHRAVAFYLSRGIDRRHYLLGKWAGLAAVISSLSIVPALLLFMQNGIYSSSFDYWLEYWWMPLTIGGYGLLMCLVLGLVVMTLAVYLQRTAPITITCFSLFILVEQIARFMSDMTRNSRWRLLSPWRDMRHAARFCCDPYAQARDRDLGGWAILILAGICLVCIAALYRRVQAVEVVE